MTKRAGWLFSVIASLRIFSGAKPAVLFLFWILLFPAFQTGAEKVDLLDMTLEELMDVRIKPVTSASKYEQKPMEAPASITVVTDSDIRRYGYRTLGDLLQGVRGFYITQDRNYSYVGFRGFNRPGDYSTRVLLLVDGIRTNDNIFETAAVGEDFILNLDLVKRVEIVRGPSYALYGNSAFFTVVNVITREAEDLEGREVSAEAGAFETVKGRVSWGLPLDQGGGLLVSGSLLSSQGQSLYFQEFDTPDQNNGLAEGCDGEKAGNAFIKYRQGDFTLESAYVKRSKQIPTGSWETLFNDPRTKTWDERAFVDLKLQHQANPNWSFFAQGTYGLYRYQGHYTFVDETSGGSYLNRDEDLGQWWGLNLHLVHTLGNHTLIAGGEYRDDFTLNQKNFDEAGEYYLDDRQSTRSWGLFFQDEFRVLPSVTLNAGLRYDDFSTFGNTVNPRFAAVYRPAPKTSLKYITGTAFRAPNAYELFYHDGSISQKANPNLDDETILSHDLVWEQLLGDHYSTTLTLYYYRVDDLISLITDPEDGLLTFINQGKVEAKGIEGEITGVFPGGLKGGVSYAFQESDFTQKGLNWTNSPRHSAKIEVSWPILKENLFLGLEEQYTGTLGTLQGGSSGDFFLTNVTLFAGDLVPDLDFSASVYNLFDTAYSIPGSDEHLQDAITQDGRSFRVKLTFRF